MPEEKAALSIKQYWRLLNDYLMPQKGRMFLLIVLGVSALGVQLANPQIIRRFLDAAETASGVEKLLGSAVLFMVIAVLGQICNVALTYVGENVAWTATNMLRADLALHCLKLDMAFHKRHKPGELIERIDGDVNQLANFFSLLVVRLGSNLLLVIGVLVLLWLQDWRLGLAITLSALVGLFALDWLNKRAVPRWQALRQMEAKLFGLVEEWLNGTEEIQTCGAKPYIMFRLYQALRNRWQKILAAMRIQVMVVSLPLSVFALVYSAAYLLGNTLFRENSITVGELYTLFFYIDMLKGRLWEILRQVNDLQRAAASINRIAEIRHWQPTIRDGTGAYLDAGPLKVVFDDVSFHYEDDEQTNVLQNLCFDLHPGSVLGLLGRTGSGKSTLTKLLLRLHDPSSGAIRLGNHAPRSGNGQQIVDIRQVRQTELRRYIGMVTQEVQLFQATVRQNLTLFNPQIDDERILQVIQDVGLGDWFATLPQGLDTHLEAGGSSLSAGEAQLIAFGRVFLTDPGLIILDEASSRLDPATEHRIEKAVDRLLENRTGIIIAHRLATVQRADEIMILEDGQIVEYGPRHELIHDPNSLFSNLLISGLEEAMV